MPHGTPDWGLVGPKSTTYGLDDLGESAVRQGSPVSHDRRGDVIWMDAFEEGWNAWHYGLFAADATIRLASNTPLHGAYHLILGSGNDDVNGLDVFKRLAYPVLGNMGLEVAFAFPPELGRLFLAISVYDGTHQRSYEVAYDLAAQTLSYWTDPGVGIPFAAGVRLSTVYSCYAIFKLVIDATAQTYFRLVLNEQWFDMRAYVPRRTVDGEPPNIAVSFGVRGDGVTDVDVYVDRVIVTQNEP